MVDPTRIQPTPSDEEAVALAAAIEVMWPKGSSTQPVVDASPRWRFSGRWWQRGRRRSTLQ